MKLLIGGLTVLACLASGVAVRGQKPPLLPEKDVAALANELSGETAKRNLEGIARFHRQRGSKGFHEAAELVAEQLRAYGLGDAAILQFPADGKIFYGTQRSRPAWDADFAELWDVGSDRNTKLASYESEPVVLAEDSETADVTTDLIDVGAGTKDGDYTGKDIKGKLVLVSTQPDAVQDLAVGKFGAAGIISYAQNQKTAWSGENQDAIRWGHLETFSPNKTFAFMVSLKAAHAFQSRLAAGEKIVLHAVVKAGQHPGNYEVVTATIPGSDPKMKDVEIAFSCHFDHQRPGANDNASGCASILEVARTLQKLIANKELAPPTRAIRFIFPPEIEGTAALLNGKPEFAKRIKAVIHMDMVGGGPETKAVFHVTSGPASLPSFVHDVAWAFAEWVNKQSYQFAATGEATYPLIALAGGKEPLRAEYSAFSMGSDHEVYQDSSFGIPTIYMNDWPDRFIHTNLDSAANIDSTKLKRAALIGAASGYFLARLNGGDYPALIEAVKTNQYIRTEQALRRAAQLDEEEHRKLLREFIRTEQRLAAIINSAIPISLRGDETRPPLPKENITLEDLSKHDIGGAQNPFWKRASMPKGPLTVFGYNYFVDHAKSGGISTPKLLDYQGRWGGGEEYTFEVLNFADGQHTAQGIRDAVSAEFGPIPLEVVVEYLQALEKIGLVERVK
ncbi:MAG TPA: M28 family peptidase [Candidatus Acidoferrum sp.]|nr:M28 family peptidase [Candidatus Acidoferrum sp.]